MQRRVFEPQITADEADKGKAEARSEMRERAEAETLDSGSKPGIARSSNARRDLKCRLGNWNRIASSLRSSR